MTTVTVHEAKTNLSRLLAMVEQGEIVVVARATKPVARLVPINGPERPRRCLGRLAGRAHIADEHWAADEIATLFGES
ncbi:MAG: type II toxin-antitoxin system prevent-host-death family antitoxin [Micrococcales bacterium]|nr:type II toxin-antitoxin system prevent-host-death family antitoxin [Micrococcales bacterium]